MSGNVGLNLYDQGKFKAFGEKLLKDCKTTVDKAIAPKQPIPIVEEKKEEIEEKKDNNTNLNVKEMSKKTSSSAKGISDSSNTASDIYDDIQGMRTEMEGKISRQDTDSELNNKLNEVEDAVLYLSENEDKNTNEKMLKLHKDYKSKYGEKYAHGSATTDNSFQREFTTNQNGFYTNNNISTAIGRKNATTVINATYEHGIVSAPKTEIDDQSDDTDSNIDDVQNSRRISTRSEDDSEYEDPEVPTQAPEPREITNDRSIDINVFHNREMTFNKRKYSVGAGAEYHNHDNGNTTLFALRGGVLDEASGFGLTITSSQYGSVDDQGQKHSLRDTKVKAVIINNEIDEYPMEEAQKDGVQDLSELPIVKTTNKFGANLVTENENLGVNASYVAYDVSSLKNNTYKRYQLYVKGGYLNEPQEQDTPDKHKIKLGATWRYQNVKANGNYFNAKINAAYHNTVQSGSEPNYVIGVDTEINTKIKHNQIGFQGAEVKTENTKFLTLTANYKYSKNNFDFGADVGYCKSEVFGTKIKYFAAGVNATYKF